MTHPVKCYQYDMDGKFMLEYDSINQASKHTGLTYSGIRGCVTGKYQYSQGYIWKDFKVKRLKSAPKGRYESNRSKFTPVVATKGKRVLEFESISECANFIECTHSAISQVLSGKYNIKTVKGWSIKPLRMGMLK